MNTTTKLTVKPGQAISIGDNITLSVLSIDPGKKLARVVIDRPDDMEVRAEPIWHSEKVDDFCGGAESVVEAGPAAVNLRVPA